MKYDGSNSNESTEQQLRRELEELKRQLHLRQQEHAGPPADRWRPSGLTVAVLVLGLLVLLAVAFVGGYLPMQRRMATVEAEAAEREKALPRLDVLRVAHESRQNEIKLPGTMQ